MLREVDGTIVFVDISGFTKMSERLARKGRVGAEEVTEVLGAVFARLLSVAYAEGGGLIKFGGDALLLLFTGSDHPVRGARAAFGMRRTLSQTGRIASSAGSITLRMSVGVHSGTFQFFLVGNDHRELVITGPAASRTVAMESTATAGEILVSSETASLLPSNAVGARKGEGFLLRRDPSGLSVASPEQEGLLEGLDLLSCIPIALRDHLLSGASEPEHRRVNVAFVHFDGVDQMVDAQGPEAVAFALDSLVSGIQSACEKHVVTFLGSDIDHDGGKIILLTGAPQAIGNDEERMLFALRAIIEAAPPIAIRIGVNRGHVFSGDIGPPYRRTYTVMGDAVNLAARVMAKAESGQLLATSEILEASPVGFNLVALEPFMVKGKSKPVNAFVVGSAVGAKPKETVSELPLVGREREVGAFRSAISDVLEERGSVIELVGDPGFGKTRLVNELRGMAAGLPQLITGCELYEATVPYLPFRRLLRLLLGAAPDHDATVVAERLRERVQERAPELEAWLPLLAAVADVDVPATSEVSALGEEFRASKLHEVTAAFLTRLVTEPTIVVIEDAHWIDEGSGDLIRYLARNMTEYPWLLCVTRRDGGSTTLVPEGTGTSFLLEPLEPEAVDRLIAVATEDAPLMPHDAHQLAHRSGGNPLFLRELLSAAAKAGTSEGLPESIEAMATAQIDSLGSGERTLLRYAAVLGMGFEEAFLRRILGDGMVGDVTLERLDPVLENLGAGRYRFRHALLRDAAYEGLPFRKRRELHAAVGEAIVSEAGADADEQAEMLSLHFFLAGDFERAWRFSMTAGGRASASYANIEAAAFYERALDAGRRVDADPIEMLNACETRGDALSLAGEYRRAADAYAAAHRLATNDPVRQAGFLLKRSRMEDRLARYPQALRWIDPRTDGTRGREGR